MTTIRIDCPSYWAHGKIFDGEEETLSVRMSEKTFQNRHFIRDWAARPADEPGVWDVDCYVIDDPTIGRFAVPVAQAGPV